MSRPSSTIGQVWLVLPLFLAVAAPAAATEAIVNFPSLDGATDLAGHLTRPEPIPPRFIPLERAPA
ncbi:hypothetical protein H8A99_28440 [Bradyrhizobium sp. Arg68]|uniref:hypothetical protein n=1 Tax=Bradyrhizobium ivorense TaxID=2511166 RepID=UPI001E4B74F7|nr:hypothetical protein [Bradyrhizobium ivorense]MCC8940281.1 hypothetical protein [Bradyrhizobium ivorense]